MATTAFEPRIVAFFCNWCTYTAADLAGVSRLKYASNLRTIRLMCSGRVDPQFILEALACGADGVTITKSEDLAGALQQAIRAKRPCVLDVHVDAEVRPPSTGTWQLPPTPYKEPAFGKPYVA